jgi:hypothetical protein
MDYLRPPREPSIEAAIEPWIEANPDLALYIDERKQAADVYLVRPDGSVATALNTLRAGETWSLNTYTSCPAAVPHVLPFGR